MTQKYSLFNGKVNAFLHGGDYNPDQWINTPEIWDEDMRLAKLSKCNAMSIGIFSWTMLEPEEGVYNFSWLDTIMDKLAANGMYAILATPSGAKPSWMVQKYPEILRVGSNRVRNLQGKRHNHCFTSPAYRRKIAEINIRLAERYRNHPALIMWHISNEYGGECHCELCQEAFRGWLKNKFNGDLEKLNFAYWTNFWSHKYTDWSQVESPAPHGEDLVHGLNLDWKRFVTYQTIDFYKNEITPLKEITPDIPVTTNFMGFYPGLDYWKFAKECDVISWDNYPSWHSREETWKTAAQISFLHDLNRSFKDGKPFLLMESTPSLVNWKDVNKLKRPGMHLLSSIQAIAHGSDSVQYFQWRKSRGSSEKLHGAVVDHCGHENTRVFRDVTEVGEYLEKLKPVAGTSVRPEVAVIFDWNNRWAIDDLQGLDKNKRDYPQTCVNHYSYFWKNGIPADIIDMEQNFSKYRLIIAPMLYMIKPGTAERLEEFVAKGGTLVTTYLSGIADENDLCFLGGFPGPLRKLLGIWAEEIDTLYDGDINHIVTNNGNEYPVNTFCELIHTETAEALAVYKSDFYAGMPSITKNQFGKGEAYYIAARTSDCFLYDFYADISKNIGLKQALDSELPEGVTVQTRNGGGEEYIFIMNFSEENKTVKLGSGTYHDMIEDVDISDYVELGVYGVKILRK